MQSFDLLISHLFRLSLATLVLLRLYLSAIGAALSLVHSSLAAINASHPTSVDSARFATATEIKYPVYKICG